jgi:hypothetical protein
MRTCTISIFWIFILAFIACHVFYGHIQEASGEAQPHFLRRKYRHLGRGHVSVKLFISNGTAKVLLRDLCFTDTRSR